MSVSAIAADARVEELPGLGHGESMQLAQEQMDALIAQLKELDPADWESPTDCERWTVRDIVAHVLAWAEVTPSPTEFVRLQKATRAMRKELPGKLDASNEAMVVARRHMSPERLVAALEDSSSKFMTFRRRLGLPGRYLPIYVDTVGLTTAGFLLRQIFTRDHFMHRIDIARATGRELVLGPSERRLVRDLVRHWGRSSKADALLRLSGPAGGNFVSGSGGRATISGDALEFCRILAGRAEPEVLDLEGDRTAAVTWLNAKVPF